MKKLIAAAGFIIVLVTCASAQSSVPDDETAIRKTALDYIEAGTRETRHAWKARYIRNWRSE